MIPPLLPGVKLTWGTPVERERRNRIRIAVFAYAYEVMNVSLVSDAEYDRLARSINTSVPTGNVLMDHFFKTHYSQDTGLWVHRHPRLSDLDRLYRKHWAMSLW